jgi:hypothetical protein
MQRLVVLNVLRLDDDVHFFAAAWTDQNCDRDRASPEGASHDGSTFFSAVTEFFRTLLGDFSTFDELNATHPTDDALAAYIRAGMGGTVPRPEITGNDLRELIYRIRRKSGAGGYTSIVTPGPDQTDFNGPIISNVVATRLSATSIQVR